MSVSIELNGLTDFESFMDRMPDTTRRAALMAINQTLERKALPLARKEIGEEVAFSKDYLKDPKRLGIAKKATLADLEAVITGRGRPTSLARFTDAPFPTPKGGVTVKVKPGQSRVMKGAFVVQLPQGKGDSDAKNRGLAVHVAPDRPLKRKTDGPFAKLAPNLYLLYGPSVNQVFRSVADDIRTPVAEYLGNEFLRQWARLAGE